MHNIIRAPKYGKSEMKRFADIIANSRKWVPPCNSYDVTKELSTTHKYKIYMLDRKTMLDDKSNLKIKGPDPTTYNPEKKYKIIGPIKSTSAKDAFIAEAMYVGMNNLAPNHYTKNHT